MKHYFVLYIVILMSISINQGFKKLSKTKIKSALFSSSSDKYAFYNSIGRPKFISAPMVDQSELAWRQLVRRHGTDICFTQMILARSYLIAKEYRRTCTDWLDYSHKSGSLEESAKAKELDKHLIIQLAGPDPDTLIKMAKMADVEGKACAIDLNLG